MSEQFRIDGLRLAISKHIELDVKIASVLRIAEKLNAEWERLEGVLGATRFVQPYLDAAEAVIEEIRAAIDTSESGPNGTNEGKEESATD